MKSYFRILKLLSDAQVTLIPYFRRIIRFLALPYCYFYLVNWDICTASRWQVVKDFAYIFFVLKYFPDNYGQCRFWEISRKQWAEYYGSTYDPYQKAALLKHAHDNDYMIAISNKEIASMLYSQLGIRNAKSIGCINGSEKTFEEISKIFTDNKMYPLLLKPVGGGGGKGIIKIVSDNNRILVHDQNKIIPLNEYRNFSYRYIIEEALDQHGDLASFNPSSVNTLRVQTLLPNSGSAIFAGANLRIGRIESYIDNLSKGGVGVAVDRETGVLQKYAYDYNFQSYIAHPDSEIKFEGYQLPYWEEIVSFCIQIQEKLDLLKFLGMDIAITQTGPVVVEVNALPDVVGFEQINGPMLNKYDVWEGFQDLGILINQPSKSLYS